MLRHPETARIVCCIDVEIDRTPAHYSDCELGRCDDVFQALSVYAQREGFTSDRAGHARRDVTHPVVFVLKLNPNAFNAPRVPLEHASRRSLTGSTRSSTSTATRSSTPSSAATPALVPYVELLYYHSKHAAHHLAAYEAAAAGRHPLRGECRVVNRVFF